MWKNMLRLGINHAAWTTDENAKLLELTQLAHPADSIQKDWDAIAEELGTFRTGFMCFMRYQQKLNPDTSSRKWTPGEDKRLLQLVEMCRIYDFVPWTKVCFF